MYLLKVFVFFCFLLTNSILFSDEIKEKQIYDKAMKLAESYRGDSIVLLEAIKILDEIGKTNPKNKYFLTAYSKIILSSGYISGYNYEEKALVKSKLYADRAISSDPKFYDAYYYGFFPYLYSNELDTAKRIISLAEQLQPKSPKTYLLHAYLANKEKRYSDAIEYASKSIENEQDKKNTRNQIRILIEAYKKKEKYEIVDYLYKKIMDIEPNTAWEKFNYGSFQYYYMKDYDKSIEYCKKALSIMEFDLAKEVLGKAYYKKAHNLYWNEKLYQDAEKYFLLATTYHPTSNAYYGLGLSYYQIGHERKQKELIYKARDALNESLKLNQENQYSINILKKVNKLIDWIDKNVD